MENKLGYYEGKAQIILWELGLVDDDWSFKYDNAKRRAGLCNGRKKIISISRHFTKLNTDEEIMNTILHEVAHALAPEREHHGYRWRKVFKELLIKYKQPVKVSRCYDHNKVKMPKGKYALECIKCDQSWQRHKKVWWLNKTDDKGHIKNVFCPRCGKEEGRLKLIINRELE